MLAVDTVKRSESESQVFELEADTTEVVKLLSGHIFFQTVFAGVEHDLFSKLFRRSMTRPEIMAALGIAEQPCRILLLGLVSLKLLHKSGDSYSNTELADVFLCSQSPRNVRQLVRFEHYIVYKAMFHFFDATNTGTNVGLCELEGEGDTIYQRVSQDPKLNRIFQDAMQEISNLANGSMTQTLDLRGVKHLVDVGGGNGTNIIELVKRFPDLKASVFDFPEVCEVAGAHFQETGFGDRLSAIPGNVFEDAIPEGPDAIMFCHFFTIWSKEKDLLLLKKAHQALPSGGRAIIFNMMQHDDETGPLTATTGSPYFLTLATGEGMLYTWKEYQSLFVQAGFKDIETQVLPNNHGVIVGYKK